MSSVVVPVHPASELPAIEKRGPEQAVCRSANGVNDGCVFHKGHSTLRSEGTFSLRISFVFSKPH
jgi:hypothetical protein